MRSESGLAAFAERNARWLLAAVLVVVAAVIWPALGNGFCMDARLVALAQLDSGRLNPLVSELRPIGDYFSTHYWAASDPSSELYRPVTILSYSLVRAVFAGEGPSEWMQAWPQHLVNIVLHLLATGFVFALVRRLGASALVGLVAAAVFGLHAIHSEVVSGIVGRAELLAFCAGAAAAWLVVGVATVSAWGGDEASGDNAKAPPPARSLIWRAPLAALLLFAAYGSKESALNWLPLILLLDAVARGFVPGARGARPSNASAAESTRDALRAGPLRRSLELLAIAVVPAAFFFVLRQGAFADLPRPEPVTWFANPLAEVDAVTRIATAIKVWGYGLLLSFAPFELAADYGGKVFEVTGFGDVGVLASLVGIVAAVVLGVMSLRARPLLGLGLLTLVGTSFLTSNVPFAIGTIFGERLYYMPSLGVAFVVAWLWQRAAPIAGDTLAARALASHVRVVDAVGAEDSAAVSEPRFVKLPVVVLVTAAWLSTCSAVLIDRHPIWKNNATLFAHEAQNQPRSPRLLQVHATILESKGKTEEARAQLQRALEVDPDFALAFNHLAAIAIKAKDFKAAKQNIVRGLEAKHASKTDRAKLLCNRAYLQRVESKPEAAIASFREALELDPMLTRARIELLDMAFGKMSPADYNKTLEIGRMIEPRNPHWNRLKGLALHHMNQPEQAIALLEPMLDLRFNNYNMRLARMVVAINYRKLNKVAEAKKHLQVLANDETASPALRARARQYLRQL